MFKVSRLILVSMFVSLTGCEVLHQCYCPPPLEHKAVMSAYPAQMQPIPYGRKVVLVGGVFDVLHYGHLGFLEAAKKQGDYLVVALEPDVFVQQHKHREPVHNQLQRAEILSRLAVVDQVVMLSPMHGYRDYLRLVEMVRPQVIAVTEGEPHLREKEQQAAHVGAKISTVVIRDGDFSTRNILSHLCLKVVRKDAVTY